MPLFHSFLDLQNVLLLFFVLEHVGVVEAVELHVVDAFLFFIFRDIEKKETKNVFQEHSGDVMSLSLSTNDANLFVSGSCDATAKVWDVRLAKSVRTFAGLHESDINSVQFFPKDECFGTGSDDSSCRLFDMRTFRQLNHFFSDKVCFYDNCYSWMNPVLCVYFLHIGQCLRVSIVFCL